MTRRLKADAAEGGQAAAINALQEVVGARGGGAPDDDLQCPISPIVAADCLSEERPVSGRAERSSSRIGRRMYYGGTPIQFGFGGAVGSAGAGASSGGASAEAGALSEHTGAGGAGGAGAARMNGQPPFFPVTTFVHNGRGGDDDEDDDGGAPAESQQRAAVSAAVVGPCVRPADSSSVVSSDVEWSPITVVHKSFQSTVAHSPLSSAVVPTTGRSRHEHEHQPQPQPQLLMFASDAVAITALAEEHQQRAEEVVAGAALPTSAGALVSSPGARETASGESWASYYARRTHPRGGGRAVAQTTDDAHHPRPPAPMRAEEEDEDDASTTSVPTTYDDNALTFVDLTVATKRPAFPDDDSDEADRERLYDVEWKDSAECADCATGAVTGVLCWVFDNSGGCAEGGVFHNTGGGPKGDASLDARF